MGDLPGMDRRQFSLGLGSILLSPWLASCRCPPLRIGTSLWAGYELMSLAGREGWIPPGAVSFREFSSASEALSALRQGTVDGASLTLDEMLRARAEGIPLTAVLVFDTSAGADVVMAAPSISRLQDLVGKRLAAEQTALGAFMLHMALAEAGLDKTQVTLLNLEVDKHVAAWRAGRFEAVVTFEPVASQLEWAGMHRVFDSRKVPGSIIDVLAVRPSVLRTHRGALRALVAGHFKARAHFKANRIDAAYRMAGHLRLSAEEVLKGFRGVELPDIAENHAFLDGPQPGLAASAQRISQVLVAAGILARPADLLDLASEDVLPPKESEP